MSRTEESIVYFQKLQLFNDMVLSRKTPEHAETQLVDVHIHYHILQTIGRP